MFMFVKTFSGFLGYVWMEIEFPLYTNFWSFEVLKTFLFSLTCAIIRSISVIVLEGYITTLVLPLSAPIGVPAAHISASLLYYKLIPSHLEKFKIIRCNLTKYWRPHISSAYIWALPSQTQNKQDMFILAISACHWSTDLVPIRGLISAIYGYI